MAITILPPAPAEPQVQPQYDESDSEDEIMESSDIARPSKRLRLLEKGSEVVTPGEIVTDDPQWMRLVFLLPAFLAHYSALPLKNISYVHLVFRR